MGRGPGSREVERVGLAGGDDQVRVRPADAVDERQADEAVVDRDHALAEPERVEDAPRSRADRDNPSRGCPLNRGALARALDRHRVDAKVRARRLAPLSAGGAREQEPGGDDDDGDLHLTPPTARGPTGRSRLRAGRS